MGVRYAPITVRSNWGYFDQIAGRDAREGDEVEVEWPDHTESRHRIKLETTSHDGARPGDVIRTVRAYIEAAYKGIPTKVFLGQPGVRVRPID
jgi:hypothetical protein